jgi:K+-transporting ATPase c subunit
VRPTPQIAAARVTLSSGAGLDPPAGPGADLRTIPRSARARSAVAKPCAAAVETTSSRIGLLIGNVIGHHRENLTVSVISAAGIFCRTIVASR